MYRYIGTSSVSFEKHQIYEAKNVVDSLLGECYSVKDESGEWYIYGKEFFENNFIAV